MSHAEIASEAIPAASLRGSLVTAFVAVVAAAGVVVCLAAGDVYSLALYLPYAATGTILRVRRPSNPTGSMLVGIGWACGLATLFLRADPSRLTAGTASPADTLIAWGQGWGWAAAFTLLFALTLVFPDGHMEGRARHVAWALVVVDVMAVLAAAATPVIRVATASGAVVDFRNPFTIARGSSLWQMVPSAPSLVLVNLTLLIGGLVHLVLRYRSSSGVLRPQLRWVTTALSTAGVAGAIAFVVAWATGMLDSDPRSAGVGLLLVWAPMLLGLVAIPVAITVAVLRYRLYEIDRLVSRTISYGVVILVLGSLYAVVAVWFPTRYLGQQPPMFVAGATLAVFVMFRPVRKWVIDWVDQRFYRTRYDSERIAERFADELQAEMNLTQLTADLTLTIDQSLQPAAVGVWVRAVTARTARDGKDLREGGAAESTPVHLRTATTRSTTPTTNTSPGPS